MSGVFSLFIFYLLFFAYAGGSVRGARRSAEEKGRGCVKQTNQYIPRGGVPRVPIWHE